MKSSVSSNETLSLHKSGLSKERGQDEAFSLPWGMKRGREDGRYDAEHATVAVDVCVQRRVQHAVVESQGRPVGQKKQQHRDRSPPTSGAPFEYRFMEENGREYGGCWQRGEDEAGLEACSVGVRAGVVRIGGILPAPMAPRRVRPPTRQRGHIDSGSKRSTDGRLTPRLNAAIRAAAPLATSADACRSPTMCTGATSSSVRAYVCAGFSTANRTKALPATSEGLGQAFGASRPLLSLFIHRKGVRARLRGASIHCTSTRTSTGRALGPDRRIWPRDALPLGRSLCATWRRQGWRRCWPRQIAQAGRAAAQAPSPWC